ncbi:sodium-dependent transporter [Thermococcus peptonophilus]|uniref:sodium-dependent transporter n=1 Tax=Thermococcus peptonophilus TaxID=53952 RepID=UPI000A78586E
MFKVSRTPGGLMITFVLFLVFVAGGITSYLSGWALIFLLGQDSSFIVLLALLTILIAALLLLMAKGRTVELLAALSVLVIVLTLVSVFQIRNEASSVIVSEQAKLYMDHVFSQMWSLDSPPLMFRD